MVAHSIAAGSAADHVRPFSMRRDLSGLADLIDAAFRDDLSATGSHMVQELRQMAAMGPMLHLARIAVPPMQGYVWVHDGQVVGNVSIARERGKQWSLSNVAVTPEMRGRGIAGHLVDQAVEHIRLEGGKQIILQVRNDHPAAMALYTHRGFSTYDTVHEITLASSHWPVILRAAAPMIRPPSWTDRVRLRELVYESTPPGARIYRGLESSQEAGTGIARRVGDILEMFSQTQDRVALVAAPEDEVVGLATVTVRMLSRWHELALHVAPPYRGRVERALLQALFGRLGTAPRREIRATVSASHSEALDALEKLGFFTHRVLDQMGRQFQSGPASAQE